MKLNYTPEQLVRELRCRADGGHVGARELRIMCGMAANAFERVVAERDELLATLTAAEARADELVQALEIIAGHEQCADNLMSNQDIARTALTTHQRQASAGADHGGGPCTYEARGDDGNPPDTSNSSGALKTWCRTHGFDCPNLKCRGGADVSEKEAGDG